MRHNKLYSTNYDIVRIYAASDIKMCVNATSRFVIRLITMIKDVLGTANSRRLSGCLLVYVIGLMKILVRDLSARMYMYAI